jgi:predicted esterase
MPRSAALAALLFAALGFASSPPTAVAEGGGSSPAPAGGKEDPEEKAKREEAEAVKGDDDCPTEDLRAKPHERMRYLLHGPMKGAKEPKEGRPLVLVLPGGTGEATFARFVRNLLRRALPQGALVAQPVAVKWRADQKVVWPSERSKVADMAFATEEFLDAVVADASKKRKVDATRVFALAWSSSGPATYAAVLREKTPICGSFIAMAVFVPDKLPALKHAKGRPFFLYQSPQDETTKFHFAEKAKEALAKEGAVVELRSYDGGHGWTGDTMEDVRHGMVFLEKNRPAAKRR